MIITEQTIYMQMLCNGATELDRDPSEGPGPRITRIKSLEEETGGECLPHQNICCMQSYREECFYLVFPRNSWSESTISNGALCLIFEEWFVWKPPTLEFKRADKKKELLLTKKVGRIADDCFNVIHLDFVLIKFLSDPKIQFEFT